MVTDKKNHQRSILWLCKIIILLQVGICNAQNHVSGFVFSAKDSTAISGGVVYFEGTSIGETTGENGEFKIVFKEGNSSLVISSIGFESVVVNAQMIKNNSSFLRIYLPEKSEELETVFLETDSWSREEKLKIFKREFLGNNHAAKSCRIINENDIKLRFIKSSNTLIASSREPLVIANEYLGYLLKYNLRDFMVKLKTINNKLVPIAVHYHGYSFFKPLRSNVSRKSRRNRNKSYLGSSFHFMRALYSNELYQNNFKLFYGDIQVPVHKFFKITDDHKLKKVALLVDKIFIIYKTNQQSVLVSKGVFTIDEFGYHSPPESINLYGEMSKKRISELLPLDYQP
ncbi:hypothetical protein AXE80_07060 [Wenyingzhuangia fucanilytica]|uniref:Carboxypeptidase-like regulatory domain-containing protein n=1 Tax=Wenyingzhuangia fucanilytica TaxID=1790137 RepID=A0A1B1Y5N0_9FLAO|nr:carboxypeptidase-like regulatory domain-containing protein [Wenyingzhuangia fucanilytica]ANW96049.1 hypothetical protein AXE80_07060 [Wenyingzhuangia fucanilytica]